MFRCLGVDRVFVYTQIGRKPARVQPVSWHSSSKITALAPLDADRYRVAVALVTALRWLIVSPMFEAVPTPPRQAASHADTRALIDEATKRFRGHL